MTAKDDAAMVEASESLYTYNADRLAQMRAQARREYLIHEQAVARREAEQAAKIEELTANYEAALAEKQAAFAEIERLRAMLAEYRGSGVN